MTQERRVRHRSTRPLPPPQLPGRVQRLPAAHLALLDIFDGMAEFTEALQVKEELDELEKG